MSSITSLLSVASVSDAVLISATRGGDASAFAEIAQRHHIAALAAARCLTGSEPDAQAVVADACTRLAQAIADGSGPEMVIRPDLLVTVHALALERRVHRDEGAPALDPALEGALEGALASFRSLPERWQLVIWHIDVEGGSPLEVAALLGLAPDAVESLSQRARDGLRQALLRAHLRDNLANECRVIAERLGSYVREGLSVADRHSVTSHLDGCERCRTVVDSLGDLRSRLRTSLLPSVVGVGANDYLEQLRLAADGAGTRRSSPRGRGRPNGRVVSAGVVVAAVLGVGIAVLAATNLETRPAALPSRASRPIVVPAAASLEVPTTAALRPGSSAQTLSVVVPQTESSTSALTLAPVSTLPGATTTSVVVSSTAATTLPAFTDVSTTISSLVTVPTTVSPTTAAPEAVPELSIRASMNGPAIESQSLAIEVQIVNVGGSPALSPRVEMTSPEGVTLGLAAGSAWHCALGTTTTCDGPTLGVGAGSSFFMIASITPVLKPVGRDQTPPVRSITSPLRLRVSNGPGNGPDNGPKRGVDIVIGDVKPNPTAATTVGTARTTRSDPTSSHDHDN